MNTSKFDNKRNSMMSIFENRAINGTKLDTSKVAIEMQLNP